MSENSNLIICGKDEFGDPCDNQKWENRHKIVVGIEDLHAMKRDCCGMPTTSDASDNLKLLLSTKNGKTLTPSNNLS